MKKLFASTLLLLALLLAMQPEKTTTIFMIGDSTMANKDISHDRKERGWGMALQCCFDDHIVVDNHAVNGRSTLSFINEGRWQAVLDKMKPGDMVIIQFGHNDEKPKADRHTDPGSTFDYNLAKFVRETREHGGVPVLMNCVVRRKWVDASSAEAGAALGKGIDDESLRNTTSQPQDEGKQADSLVFVDTHGLYRVAPRDVAQRMHCFFVDANKITEDLEKSLGVEGSKKLHMYFEPGEEPSVPKGRQDNTHYNVHGAQVVASLLADALIEEVPLLGKYRVRYDIAVDKRGRGDHLSLQQALAQVPEGRKCTIQLLGGEWEKPALSKKQQKEIEFVMRFGAKWKEGSK